MHDIRALRADPAAFDADLARRGLEAVTHYILGLDEQGRRCQTELQNKHARRKALARDIGQRRRAGEETESLEAEGVALRVEMEALEEEANTLEGQMRACLEQLPNRLDPKVPDGLDESANVVQHVWGMPRIFSFTPRQHFELGEALGMMDFATASRLSGARFVVLHRRLRTANSSRNRHS